MAETAAIIVSVLVDSGSAVALHNALVRVQELVLRSPPDWENRDQK